MTKNEETCKDALKLVTESFEGIDAEHGKVKAVCLVLVTQAGMISGSLGRGINKNKLEPFAERLRDLAKEELSSSPMDELIDLLKDMTEKEGTIEDVESELERLKRLRDHLKERVEH